MNIIDVVIILLLLLSAIIGMKRGVLKELVMLIGVIIIYIISFHLKDSVGIFLCRFFPFFSFDGLISLNIFIYQLIAFIVIASLLFSIYGIILKLTGILQKVVDLTIILTIPSKLLGAIAGFIEGYVILFIILLTISIPFKNNDLFVNSKLNHKIIMETPVLSSSLGNLDRLILDIIEVTKNIPEEEKNKTNLKLLDIYLEYKVIDQKDLDLIISTGKLDKIKGIINYKS